MKHFSNANTNACMHVHVWVCACVWMSAILCELVVRSDIFPTDETKVTLIIGISRTADLEVILKWIFTCSLSLTERLYCNSVSTTSVEILYRIITSCVVFRTFFTEFCCMASAPHCLVKLVQDWKFHPIMIMKQSESTI